MDKDLYMDNMAMSIRAYELTGYSLLTEDQAIFLISKMKTLNTTKILQDAFITSYISGL